jgi:hypothetical protein
MRILTALTLDRPIMISIMRPVGRSISLAVLLMSAWSCARTVRAWPPPIIPGTTVHVQFATPRSVVFEGGPVKDSVGGILDLRGTVLALHGDTLVLSVARVVPGDARESRMVGHQATLILGQSTVVTLREVDGWKFAYALLAGSVLIFAAAVMSGS